MKIVENKRKSRAGLKQLFNYINRDNAIYKTGGIGVADDKEIAFKQMILNKKDSIKKLNSLLEGYINSQDTNNLKRGGRS